MSDVGLVESALLFETPQEIFLRVFRFVRPGVALPEVQLEFCPFANANSFIRLDNGMILARVTDVLKDAPAPILEALAYILLSKLYRRPVPRVFLSRYRLFLNRKDVRQSIQGMRRERGRKQIRHPKGQHFDLDALFEELNIQYFGGLMARPQLGWSARASRTTLGHYDPSHHVIILSKALDRENVPPVVVEYVMFHEMLHLRYPVEHRGARRCVHTAEFKLAEREFANLKEAKEILRKLL